MRNRRSTIDKKKKFEKDLGYEVHTPISIVQQLTARRVKNISVMPCQQQTDNFSCGPMCLGFLWALSGGNNPNRFWFNSTEIRKNILKIAEDINKRDTDLGKEVQKRNITSTPLVTVRVGS